MCPRLFNYLIEVRYHVVQDYCYHPLSQTSAILVPSVGPCLQNMILSKLVDCLHLLMGGGRASSHLILPDICISALIL